MALSAVLIISLIAFANAGYRWVDEPEHDWDPFAPVRMLNKMFYNTQPRAPNVPHRPNFPFGGIGLNFPIAPMSIPSTDEIINAKPGPNQVFNGVAVRSSSGFKKDKDGNLVRTGGTSFVSNNNGQVEQHQSGDCPPDINAPLFPSLGI